VGKERNIVFLNFTCRCSSECGGRLGVKSDDEGVVLSFVLEKEEVEEEITMRRCACGRLLLVLPLL
jgi:hypothetical protein